mmetsp:Transcript_12629/g.26188  ORF Transcript_12629/g.26188 Transcript_12629/m.26188 type:complete len:222 (+) Transcript_12629:39-704(+)
MSAYQRASSAWGHPSRSDDDLVSTSIPRIASGCKDLGHVPCWSARARAQVKAQASSQGRLRQGRHHDPSHIRPGDGRRLQVHLVVMANHELVEAGRSVDQAAGLHDGEGQARRHQKGLHVELKETDVAIAQLLQEGVWLCGAHRGAHDNWALEAMLRLRKCGDLRLAAMPIDVDRKGPLRVEAIVPLALGYRTRRNGQGGCALHGRYEGLLLGDVTDKDAL